MWSHQCIGSISDVKLTGASGFLRAIKDKPGISIMADNGFTLKDMLKELIDFNFLRNCHKSQG